MQTGRVRAYRVYLLVAAAPILVGAGAAVVRHLGHSDAEAGEIAQPSPNVRAFLLESKEHAIVETFYGVVRPAQRVDLISELGGTVISRGAGADSPELREGTDIKKGDVLVKLEDTRLQSGLAQAQAALKQSQGAHRLAEQTVDEMPATIAGANAFAEEYDALDKAAKRNLEETTGLHQSGSATDRELASHRTQVEQTEARKKLAGSRQDLARRGEEKAKTELAISEALMAQAQVALESAKKELAKSEIRSPFDGTLVKYHATIGQTVAPGIPLVTVMRMESVKLVLQVVEKKIHWFRPGQKVKIGVRSLGAAGAVAGTSSETFEGTVQMVAVAADDRTGLFEVEVTVENRRDPKRDSEWVLKPGMVGQSYVVVDKPVGYAVPIRAVHEDGDRRYVWALSKPAEGASADLLVVHRRLIEVRRITKAGYLVDNIPPDSRIIVLEGHDQLEEGQSVRVINRSELTGQTAVAAGAATRPGEVGG